MTATRWPDPELVADFSQGVQQAVTQEFVRYWATEYDWRRCERRPSALPNVVTETDGPAGRAVGGLTRDKVLDKRHAYLIHLTGAGKGDHFAACPEPGLVIWEVPAAFRSLP
ncbi:hypothetical protein GCM10023215_31420 [Pseudonocardia yuanmonensis]|uniref:Epoxide hydrolase N-terminal domain-containing protein n=2 Tax=Pseudonocardia yuanmonensis TaxID=1095914 RepID=A0ABP8WMW8_9PSEU